MYSNSKDHLTIEGYKALPGSPLRPFVAIKAVIELVRNKEDTTQVFKISEALSGNSHNKLFAGFVRSAYGKKVVDTPIEMEKILGDFDRLRAMPDGSFGRAYLEFMESGGLTPEGLIEVAEESGVKFRKDGFEAYTRFAMHFETIHDVWHVVTGYNRDALGELCLLETSRILTYNKSFSLITFVGGMAIKKEQPSFPIRQAKREAVKNAKVMAWLPSIDFEALLPLPLEEVRAQLNIRTPEIYNSIPQDVKDKLLKPVNDNEHEMVVGAAAE